MAATKQLVGTKYTETQKIQPAQNAISKKLDLNPEKSDTRDPPQKIMRGKFLNNVDELNDIL